MLAVAEPARISDGLFSVSAETVMVLEKASTNAVDTNMIVASVTDSK